MTLTKKQKQELNTTILLNYCDEHNVEYEIITDYQFRLMGFRDVDIYPKGKKYFILEECKWGSYETMEDITNLLFNKY